MDSGGGDQNKDFSGLTRVKLSEFREIFGRVGPKREESGKKKKFPGRTQEIENIGG